MTGCLYISPIDPSAPNGGVIPILFADALVTWKSPHLTGAPNITPVSVNSSNRTLHSAVTLARKLHIIDSPNGSTAVALAGDGALINECISTLRWNIADWEKTPRPMRAFGDNVNLYKGRIEAIAIYAPKNGFEINSMARDGLCSLPNLGQCAWIGSGSRDLEDIARSYGPNMENATLSDFVIVLSNAITGGRIARELMYGQNDSWGGFVEMACLIGDPPIWQRGQSSLHYFFKVHKLADESRIVTSVPRIIAYDPGKKTEGFILSLSSEDGQAIAHQFVLGSTKERVTSSMDWRGWRPRTGALTFMTGEGADFYTITATVATSDLCHLKFNIGDKSMEASVDQDLLDRTIADIQARASAKMTN